MSGLSTHFADLRAAGRKAFIPFLTAGDPDMAFTLEALRTAADAGADIIEVGFPFSDPIADGPIIQASYTRALRAKIRLDDIFLGIGELTKSGFRVPLVGMVSYSLIHRRGPERFLTQAREAGFRGLIVPDLPIEEAEDSAELCRTHGLDLILLVTPTTSAARAEKITRACSGFVYCVSIVGITGTREQLPTDLTAQIARLRTLTPLPLCIGFGVSKPEHVRELRPIADGVIVGSALVRHLDRIAADGRSAVLSAIHMHITALATALR